MRIAHVGRRNSFCFGTALRKAPAPGCETLTKRTASRTDAPCRSSSSFLHSVWWDTDDHSVGRREEKRVNGDKEK